MMSLLTSTVTIRVSVRELHEIPYRALRVAGASHGEAQSAAEAVQFAELQQRTGLNDLLEFCGQYRWGQRLSVDRQLRDGQIVFQVSGAPLLDPLQVSERLVDLLTSTATTERTNCSILAVNLPVTSILDLPLTRAAARLGRALVAVEHRGEEIRVRLATAHGALAHGEFARGDFSYGELEHGTTSIAVLDEAPVPLLQGMRLMAAELLQERRANAALEGATVSRTEWEQLKSLSERFKKPEMS